MTVSHGRPRDLAGNASGESVVAAIAEGDLSKLGVLFDDHADEVRRFLSRLGVEAADLDDLVQETFLDVSHAASHFRAGASVRPWLFGLAAMVVRRHRRSLRRALARVRAIAFEPTPTVKTPAEEAVLGEQARRARAALASLSAKKREVFVLVSLEGFSCKDAASALGIPVATVWTRLHHARTELRRALGEEGS